MSTQEDPEAVREKEYERRLHANNIQTPGKDYEDEGTAEILRYLSNIDDLPIKEDDEIMGQLVSKLNSTANLSSEDIRSNEWIREYLLVLYLSQYPTKEGMHGTDRAWAHDDLDEFRDPMDPERRAQLEAFVPTSNLALTRSDGMSAVKEATRTVSESIVNDNKDSGKSGGILGRIKG